MAASSVSAGTKSPRGAGATGRQPCVAARRAPPRAVLPRHSVNDMAPREGVVRQIGGALEGPAQSLPWKTMTVADDAVHLSEAHRRRAVILAVRPEVDGGHYPAKRVVGEPLVIEADIVGDGHDALRAVALDRPASRAAWRETE